MTSFDDVKFETASLLAYVYQQEDRVCMSKATKVLRKAIELSQHNIYWHCKLLFQLSVSNNLLIIEGIANETIVLSSKFTFRIESSPSQMNYWPSAWM